MVLAAGRTDVQKLMSGDPAGKKFAKIVVGTSSTPVTENDTTITGAVAKDILTVNYFADGHVQFNTTLDPGDPAMTINEVGILNVDGVLCYRKVVNPLNKVAGASVAINYKIKVQ